MPELIPLQVTNSAVLRFICHTINYSSDDYIDIMKSRYVLVDTSWFISPFLLDNDNRDQY